MYKALRVIFKPQSSRGWCSCDAAPRKVTMLSHLRSTSFHLTSK